jgi:hypothetical protein
MFQSIIDGLQHNFPIMAVYDQTYSLCSQNCILYFKQSQWQKTAQSSRQSRCSIWWAHALEDSIAPFKNLTSILCSYDGYSSVYLEAHYHNQVLQQIWLWGSRIYSIIWSGCLLRYTLILSSHLQHVLLSGPVWCQFLVNILYEHLILFHFCVSFLSIAVPY